MLHMHRSRARRPRRFFGISGVVRRRRRPDVGETISPRPPRSPRSPEVDRALQSERARFAAKLDLELRLACRSEAAMRREFGCAARTFVGRRAYRRLGFVRLSDYASERLGVSARTLQSAAWLATRLDALPAVSRAYDRSELSWAQARAICRVAAAADEDRWLALARRSTVATLDRLVARAERPGGVPPDPEGEGGEIDGEPAVRWRFACPARVRALWRHALALASRVAGEPLGEWRAAEIVAAEGSSGRPAGTSLGDRALLEALRLVHRACRARRGGGGPDASAVPARIFNDAPAFPDIAAAGDVGNDPVAALRLEPPPSTDPFALDARLAEAMRVLRTIEPRIGQLLRVVADQRFYRSFGYAALDAYVRERLGISARKAWALLAIEKAALRSGEFGQAYREGRLSWIRALALLPVLDREHAPAWIARAEGVTVRRLADEVDWVLASRDALGPRVSLAPPPLGSRLPPPLDSRLPLPTRVTAPDECRDSSPEARLHIGAGVGGSSVAGAGARGDAENCHSPAARRDVLEVSDAEVRFTGPASVVALLRDVLDAFADPAEPRWIGLERLLRHVITFWESTPRHHDPVFARDRWRCTVPACSSRRNLHDHHIRFRSRGGDNLRRNRTTVCAAHHLHGLHDGTIQASGVAPHAIEWRLGVRPGVPPFLVCVGDRYCSAPVARSARGDDGRRASRDDSHELGLARDVQLREGSFEVGTDGVDRDLELTRDRLDAGAGEEAKRDVGFGRGEVEARA